MAEVVIMPKQGQSVESCIITELKKKTGDSVKKGDVLFTYETDKASLNTIYFFPFSFSTSASVGEVNSFSPG